MLLPFLKYCNSRLKKIVKYNKICKNSVYNRKYLCYNNINKSDKKDIKKDVLRRNNAMEDYSVFDIANWFLSKKGLMDHKKLQKLCYYSQAWSYVIYHGECLFNGNFEAWVHGPVNRALWNKLKGYGYCEIPSNELINSTKEICEEKSNFLERVWATYGDLSSDQLESLTHTEEPWIRARNGIPEMQICTKEIEPQIMQSYYSSKYSGDGCGE